MPRPIRKRQIFSRPMANYFKPAGIRLKEMPIVVLFFEEFEAVRLKDLENKEQKEAAIEMNVSQSTFHRILLGARKKIADAIVNGKAIKIEWGNFIMKEKKEDEIKVAVSATSDKIEAQVDSRFGRCPYFLIVTIKDDHIIRTEAVKNLQTGSQGGAGIATVEQIAKHNVDAVITNNIGPRALDVLKQWNIPVYQFQGPIQDAIASFIAKKLQQI